MRPSHFITLVTIVVLSWASTFITVINQSHKTGVAVDQTRQIVERTNALSKQNKSLSYQIKNLEQENRDLTQQSRDQSLCFVKAFAIYTQTYQPITIGQILGCNVALTPKLGLTPISTSTTTASKQTVASQPTPQTNTTMKPTQPSTGSGGGQSRGPVNSLICGIPLVGRLCN